MEKYINEDTIVKNELYDLFKDNIKCSNCSRLMIEPSICLGCQNTFCKKCIEECKTTSSGSCPNKCENSTINDVIGKNKFITKFKFKCIKGCGEEISYDNIQNHYNTDCLSKKKKIRPITGKEAANYKNIPHISSKNI